MRAIVLAIPIAVLALISCAPDNDEKREKKLGVGEHASAIGPPTAPSFIPPKTQSARCTGVDRNDQTQTLALESRWVPADGRTVLFVVEDSTGLLKPGTWLEKLSSSSSDSDRKASIVTRWDGEEGQLSKRVGDKFVRITFTEHDFASASVVYLTRPYSEREETGARYYEHGHISLVGHCRLLYGNKPKSYQNQTPIPRLS